MPAQGPRCQVFAASLISGKIIVQYTDAPYARPEDLVTAVDALRNWRNETLTAHTN
jgi:hypothetical protein